MFAKELTPKNLLDKRFRFAPTFLFGLVFISIMGWLAVIFRGMVWLATAKAEGVQVAFSYATYYLNLLPPGIEIESRGWSFLPELILPAQLVLGTVLLWWSWRQNRSEFQVSLGITLALFLGIATIWDAQIANPELLPIGGIGEIFLWVVKVGSLLFSIGSVISIFKLLGKPKRRLVTYLITTLLPFGLLYLLSYGYIRVPYWPHPFDNVRFLVVVGGVTLLLIGIDLLKPPQTPFGGFKLKSVLLLGLLWLGLFLVEVLLLGVNSRAGGVSVVRNDVYKTLLEQQEQKKIVETQKERAADYPKRYTFLAVSNKGKVVRLAIDLGAPVKDSDWEYEYSSIDLLPETGWGTDQHALSRGDKVYFSNGVLLVEFEPKSEEMESENNQGTLTVSGKKVFALTPQKDQGKAITAFEVSRDSDTVALIVQDRETENGELYLVDATGEQRHVDIAGPVMYGGYEILFLNSARVVMGSFGGDACGGWGEIFTYDLAMGGQLDKTFTGSGCGYGVDKPDYLGLTPERDAYYLVEVMPEPGAEWGEPGYFANQRIIRRDMRTGESMETARVPDGYAAMSLDDGNVGFLHQDVASEMYSQARQDKPKYNFDSSTGQITETAVTSEKLLRSRDGGLHPFSRRSYAFYSEDFSILNVASVTPPETALYGTQYTYLIMNHKRGTVAVMETHQNLYEGVRLSEDWAFFAQVNR